MLIVPREPVRGDVSVLMVDQLVAQRKIIEKLGEGGLELIFCITRNAMTSRWMRGCCASNS